MFRPFALQRAERALARAAVALPDPAVAALAGAPVEVDGRTLDRRVQLVLRLNRLARKPALTAGTVEAARRGMEAACAIFVPDPPEVGVEDTTLAGRPARVYRATGAGPGAFLFFHGGGWTLGSLDSHDVPCRRFARETGLVVVSVDYRLAPEHPFPAAYDDALAAFRALAAEAGRFGVDPARIAVGGDSAGGNLTVGVALATRGDPVRPRFQLPLYPGLDATCSMASHRTVGRGFYLEEDDIRWFLDRYAPPDRRDVRMSPWFAADIGGQPPGVLFTAGFDPLRDEGDAWAARAQAAGVDLALRSHPGLIHGWLQMTDATPAAEAAFGEACDALRRAVGSAPRV